MNNKIMDRAYSTVYVRYLEYTNITAKAFIILIILVIHANCLDSLLRNKAKNALSLAETISPVLARAKIQRNWFAQGKRKKFCVY